MKHYLLLDIGTGNGRAALVRSDGKILAIRRFGNRYYRDESYPDAQFFLPDEWKNEILRACREVTAEYPDIRVDAVSASGARQSLVLMNRDGEAFYGLPNIDNRGREFMGEVQNREDIYRRSGKWVTEDFCAAKLLGLRKKKPELYEQIGLVLSLSGYIGWLFSGKAAFEPSMACETQLYDLETCAWSDMLCKAYGIEPGILPELAMAGEVLGPVLPELRRELNMAENAVFVVGGADTQCALMQTGYRHGDIAVVSGTTTPVCFLVDRPYYDERQRVWVDANLANDGYLIEMNPGITGLNYQRIKESLFPDTSYEELEAAYREKRDFRCTASYSSLLFYEQRPLKTGGFFVPAPFPEHIDRVDMLWAVLADIACATYEQLWRLRELSGHRKPYVLGCAGGFRSPALCQMLADLSGLELRLLPGFEQATVIGLIKLCSRALKEPEAAEQDAEVIRYTPQENSLIHRYHSQWNRNRLALNPAPEKETGSL